MMPTITIIIPVYNTEEYLEDCLQSVALQTFTDYEVILIDDGSNDRSGDICDSYAAKDKRFKVIHNDNRGVSAARNIGIKCANSKYLTFVDSDDIILQNYLGDMLALMRERTQIVLSDIDGKEKKEVIDVELTPHIFTEHPHVLNGSPVNKLFLKSIIYENDLEFPDDISTMEDNIFVWKYLANCKTLSISNTNNYMYNQHEGSLVRSTHRIEEINKLCKAIMPVYLQLTEKLLPKTMIECDKYLFVSCLKRLLISNSVGLSIAACRTIISESVDIMQPIILRMSKLADLTIKDKFLLTLMEYHWIWSLAMLNRIISNKK